ncbi:MAG: Glycosyltransferase [candidate division WS6 bacterium GW2011_GWF2_39_15]|uniref:Glycosyltransferase n=1 Tax=candidate division WS6 bacterium GW2011_GWF2_39_15 TaxID=1619100 RepID=A0A0G0Q5R4_9BACT|nr:MAG: Glycosyltransferase [candidate division WS6 bacterium GW2011_GWF2_39_15]
MKKVIVLLFNDFTNDNRVSKECKSLNDNGYEVELASTSFDKSLPKSENIKGFKVRRFNVGSFKFLPFNLILFWLHTIINYRKEGIFHANDLYALPPAYVIKKVFNKKAKIIYDCHEHETEAPIYNGKFLLKKAAQLFERKMIYSADRVIVVSESIGKDYMEMYGLKKLHLVMNCPYFKSYASTDLFRKELGIPKDKVIFLYQGLYKEGRGVENLVELFKRLSKINDELVLVLLTYGEGIEALKESIKGIKNIYWHDKAPLDVYMSYVASADWGILLIENICKSYNYALPNKLFDYVMCGLPVIVSNLKEVSQFVEREKVGYVIDSTNMEEMIKLLSCINSESRARFTKNLESTSRRYTWENQEKELLNLYNTLT